MKISINGIKLIKSFEGLELSAYKDKAGVWTIGYGSTRYADGKPVKAGDRLYNEPAALALLSNTVGEYERALTNRCHVPLNQNQIDGLVSFLYNAGTAAGQTLFAKLNLRDYQGAADQLLLWNKITDPATNKKIVSTTLVKRRTMERALFLKPIA